MIRDWLAGDATAPLLLRHCEVCGEKSWRPLAETVRGITIDARLPGGKRADAILTDAAGEVELVIQLEGGTKLENRIEPRAGLPLVVLRAATLEDEPHRWRTLREHGLTGWRCRCAGTRSLPVDDDFSLRVIGCPIHLRTDAQTEPGSAGRSLSRGGAGTLPGSPHSNDGQQFYARVIEDCGRCAFFVGIGYVGNDRRRIQLRCGYGAPPVERRPAVPAPGLGPNQRRQIVAGS
ncbi:MAG TPA: hypothetical protein VN903_22045 [Polyangia bacterium]|nr:hypothetical protein [Polyangia bacterium]